MRIGIIGYGSMGKMLIWKFSGAGLTKDELYVSNRTVSKLDEAKDIATICSNEQAAKSADLVFVCVRPSDLKQVLEQISPVISKDALLVTLNGSITFDLIRTVIDHKTAKVIPSLTAEIDRSQTIVCYNDLVDQSDKDQLVGLLEHIGNVIELPEN